MFEFEELIESGPDPGEQDLQLACFGGINLHELYLQVTTDADGPSTDSRECAVAGLGLTTTCVVPSFSNGRSASWSE